MRFREFEGEWKEYKLSDIAYIVGGGTPDTTKEEYWNGEIQWFTPTEIKTNYVSKSQRTISKLGLNNSSAKLLPKGTILLTSRATIGDAAIALEECSTNQGFQSLLVKNGNNNIFVLNWIITMRNYLIKKAKGSTFLEISKSEIENISIPIPTILEQNKIASFLSLLDDRISTQSQIIESLETLIKRLSKKLLSQKLRFKDDNGNDFHDWEMHKLSDICLFYSGGTPQSTNKSYYNGSIPFIRSGEINSDKTELFISEAGLTNSSAKTINQGDLLIALYGATSGEIAISKMKGAINQAILCVKTTQNKEFLKFLWKMHKEQILLSFLQGGQGNLSAEIIKNLNFFFPKIEEQDKIATLLSVIEYKLTVEQKLLSEYQKQKTYLLNQMFI